VGALSRPCLPALSREGAGKRPDSSVGGGRAFAFLLRIPIDAVGKEKKLRIENVELRMKERRFRKVLLFAIPFFLNSQFIILNSEEVPENRFVFAQLQHAGQWDPYPTVWDQASLFLKQTTSVSPWPQRRVLSLDDPLLFESPFLALTGRGAPVFSENQIETLRIYLSGGGFLFIDNTEAERNSPFARAIKDLPERLFPGSAWQTVPGSHALFRSFFLLRGVSGRRLVEPDVKGLWIQDRLAAVYSANDLQGAWVRDPLGNYLLNCEPGGEPQRLEAFKLTVNLIVFSLTGTYKTDAIHQPFIEQKLRQ
jgi:hypothetical protein